MDLTRDDLVAMDAADLLAPFRDRFHLPEGVIYLDGNSLGALPRATPARVARMVEQEWGQGLIRSWNDAGWIDLPTRIGDKIAQLIGAAPSSVMVADSTSVNVFKVLSTALAMRPDRTVILSEAGNFPTDLYIAEGLAALLDRGLTLRQATADELHGAIGPDIAVVMLTHVNYHTGRMHDMAAITARAHAAGALMIWDLAHSAGVMPVDLAGCQVDFAVGCGYKFLNGGPGAPAFLYVAPALQAEARFPITGWFGHASPFAFEPGYRPAPGIQRAAVGTPQMLGLAALEVGVDLMLEADLRALRAKSLAQTGVFARLVRQMCDLPILAHEQRGSQLCLTHPNAYAIMQALIARGVIGDFRAPDVLRFGITPLYVGFAELWDATCILAEILTTEVWRQERFSRKQKVT